MICLQRKMSQDNSLLLREKCQGEFWPYIISKRWGTRISRGKVFIMWYCSITMTLYFCSPKWLMHAVCNHSFSAPVCQLFIVALLNSCIQIDCNKGSCWFQPIWKQHIMKMPAHRFCTYSLTDSREVLDYPSQYWAAFLKPCNKDYFTTWTSILCET